MPLHCVTVSLCVCWFDILCEWVSLWTEAVCSEAICRNKTCYCHRLWSASDCFDQIFSLSENLHPWFAYPQQKFGSTKWFIRPIPHFSDLYKFRQIVNKMARKSALQKNSANQYWGIKFILLMFWLSHLVFWLAYLFFWLAQNMLV